MPLQSTLARAGFGNAPAPATLRVNARCRPAARSSPGTRRARVSSLTSPRKASVTCHSSRLVQRRSSRASRKGAQAASRSSRAAGGGASPTNSLTRYLHPATYADRVNRVPRWLLPTVLGLLVLVVVIGAVVRLAGR